MRYLLFLLLFPACQPQQQHQSPRRYDDYERHEMSLYDTYADQEAAARMESYADSVKEAR